MFCKNACMIAIYTHYYYFFKFNWTYSISPFACMFHSSPLPYIGKKWLIFTVCQQLVFYWYQHELSIIGCFHISSNFFMCPNVFNQINHLYFLFIDMFKRQYRNSIFYVSHFVISEKKEHRSNIQCIEKKKKNKVLQKKLLSNYVIPILEKNHFIEEMKWTTIFSKYFWLLKTY